MRVPAIINKLGSLLEELLTSNAIPYTDLVPSSLPDEPGVYRIFENDADSSETIYVGESTNLSNRIYAHLMANRRASTLKNKLIRDADYSTEDEVKGYLRTSCSA